MKILLDNNEVHNVNFWSAFKIGALSWLICEVASIIIFFVAGFLLATGE